MSNFEPQQSASARTGLRILWVKAGPLLPANTGGRIRTWQMLRALHRENDVTFLALCEPREEQAQQAGTLDYASRVEMLPWEGAPRRSFIYLAGVLGNMVISSLPFSLWRYRSRAMAKRLLEADRSGKYDLIVCDFLTPAVNFAARGFKTRTVLFQHNIEAIILERMAATTQNPVARRLLKTQHRRMEKWEERFSRRFHGVITVSPDDSKVARECYGLTNVLGEVPTGVDPEYFATSSHPSADDPPTVGFLGSMDWMPNIDGVAWFLKEVWPGLKQAVPSVRFLVIGRNPPAALRNLAANDAAVSFTGTVADVRPHLAKCHVTVVPLLAGGGTRLKILEVMAAGLPVVSTTVGAEGLPLVADRHLLIADTAETFGVQTMALLKDRAMADRLVEAARTEVVESHSWERCSQIFLDLCLKADAPLSPPIIRPPSGRSPEQPPLKF